MLVDPVWSYRVSPSPVFGPTRLHPAPMPLSELPPVDAVLISHDHYDHLDLPTVEALLESQSAPFVVPLGIGEHLRTWGVPDDRIVELDWNGSTTIGGLTLTCTEARHFSGRFFSRDTTLWASWVVAGPRHRVFFGGDTGYTPAFAEIGARLGPFDLTLLPVGAYNDAWHAIHMDPEEAMRAHGDLGGRRAPADPLGHLQPGVPPLGRAGGAGARRRRARGRAARRPPAGAAGRRARPAAAHRLVDGRSARPTRPSGRRGPASRTRC